MSLSNVLPEGAGKKMPQRPQKVDKYVDAFLALMCDTSRRYILELLALPSSEGSANLPEHRSGEIAQAIGLSAATTSEHLRQLVQAGLITSRREGNIVYYQLFNQELVQAFKDLLKSLEDDYAIKSSS